MNKSFASQVAFSGLVAVLAFTGCDEGTKTTSPPAGQDTTSPATTPPTATPIATTPTAATSTAARTPIIIKPTEASHRSNTGPNIEPAGSMEPARFGHVQGRVLWNEKPAADIEVQLCENVYIVGGCQGPHYSAKTDAQGNYTMDAVPPGDYSLAVRVFDSDSFIFPTNGSLLASKYTVKSGETLHIRATNLLKRDLQILSPRAGEKFKTGLPQFSWKPYLDAATYEVTLMGIPHSEPQTIKTAAGEVTPETPLLNGMYLLKVTALNSNGVALATNASRVLFRIDRQGS